MKSLKYIRDLLEMGETEGIAKRYMVINSFDGSLTALGIIIGSFLAGVVDPRTLLALVASLFIFNRRELAY